MGISSKVKTITPAMAKAYLEKNTLNRALSKPKVSQYARDMKAKHWLVNHQGIGFDEEGSLIDGQHRLNAIIEANVPVDMLVTTGLPKSSQNGILIHTMDTVDRGRPRGIGQQLSLRHGYTYGNQAAAAAKVIASICVVNPAVPLSTAQTLRILDIYGEAVSECLSEVQIRTDRAAGILGTMAFARVGNKDLGAKFAADFYGMENLKSKHPALALRKWMANHSIVDTTARWGLVKVVASAIHSYSTNSTLTKIYQSETSFDWLRAQQKANVRTVCEMLA